MSEQSIPAARDLVGRVLEDIPERQHHCAGVAARAQTLAVKVPQASAAELVAAAWLHDIGYGSLLRDTGFHPIDGAQYLRGEAGSRRFTTLSRIIRVAALSRTFAGSTIECASSNSSRIRFQMLSRGAARREAQTPVRNSWTARANPERDDYIRAAARRVAHRLAAVGQRDPA
jgi:hypothetical protein